LLFGDKENLENLEWQVKNQRKASNAMVAKNIKLKNLDLNPLSVAKYFYEKGIETNSIMQDLLYLSYLEVIKKENALLFAEEFQAWEGGPTLHSVFYAMSDYMKNNETYEGLFEKVPSIKNKTIISHLENIHRQYKKHEVQKNELDFYEKAKDKAWKITRKPLNGSLKSRPIIKIKTIANSLRI
jgi:uncharacterized phage-associated protein